MSPYRRNLIVGITVVIALAALGWMILKFGSGVGSIFASKQMIVKFEADRADGVGDGSPITYRGLECGHVTKVELAPNRMLVFFEGSVNAEPKLPANLIARIRTASALGSGSAVTLDVDGPPSADTLKEGQVIKATYVGLGELVPMQEFGNLATELTKTVRQIHESNLVAHLDEQVRNAGKMIDSVMKLVDDEKVREDVKTSLANIRTASESAKKVAADFEKLSQDMQKISVEANSTIGEARVQITRTGNNLDSLSRQMGDRLLQISRLMDQFQSIAEKVDKGQGSAGQLVNDVRLYESMVDTSRELNATIKDFKRLVEQWEQEGVSLKLK